ncbi:MAG: magnesium transporter [Deltaproteobacteria bacterium]|nr:magnesium transporter [Deltaproteobacteria bacterium]
MTVVEELTNKAQALLEDRSFRELRDLLGPLFPADIAEIIGQFSPTDQAIVFRILPRELAADIFEYLELEHQTCLLAALGDYRVALILNEMDPDDRTALLEEIPAAAAKQLIKLLSKEQRQVAITLLGFPENSVGRLMNPEYLAVKQDWSMTRVLEHIRAHGEEVDVINTIYVLDEQGRLVADIRIREVLLAPPDLAVKDLIGRQVVALRATQDQEEAVEVFKKYDRNTLPVVDSQGVMMGIVTADDMLDIAEEEATEDIQKLGAVEALEEPYISIPLSELVHNRARWLVVLFVGELLTATAMGYFEKEIEQAIVLALFIPLVISSGGNSGSQAATLIIRSLSIGEIELSDWRRVLRREFGAGALLGLLLGTLGFLRIALWAAFAGHYGDHWPLVGFVVGFTLLTVVLWGAVTGAMLPFIMQRLGADPAASSTPFVATLVDVTGVVIYFSVASVVLSGTLL